MVMRALVTYASKHGSTQEMAQRIASGLSRLGVRADVRPMSYVDEIDGYDVVVIGSAIYMGRWIKEATEFVDRMRPALARIRVWVFSSGPLGDKPGVDPPHVAELKTSLNVVEHRVFAGALRREHLSLVERAMVKGVKAPYGDFRDWSEIDSWAASIARNIKAAAGFESIFST
jgi:menaquinone-dependent protoporphyrinogen oxidase